MIEQIQSDLQQVKCLDVKLGAPAPGSWRAYGAAHGETNETFEKFVSLNKDKQWPDHRPLFVQKIGNFSDIDLKIIQITFDFLSVVHCIPVKLQDSVLTMEELKDKYIEATEKELVEYSKIHGEATVQQAYSEWNAMKNGDFKDTFPRQQNHQYMVEKVLFMMRDVLQPSFVDQDAEKVDKHPQVIAFTSEDLYAEEMSNFVFGAANIGEGVGVWSKARLGDPSKNSQAFQTCLKRMMKVAAHEFGHMRGLPLCTDYQCNMGGGMSVLDFDTRSLLDCEQDTAKICYLTQTPLLKHHQNVLNFFQTFQNNYGVNCDFSEEMGILKARIAKML